MNQATPLAESSGGMGYLILHVTTARGAIPLEGATVNIRAYEQGADPARGDVIATRQSLRDGNTERIPLPAPRRAESLTPNDGKRPYALYVAEVHLEGYRHQTYIGLPIFDSITAIQPADLTPLPENGVSDGAYSKGEEYFEAPDGAGL